MPGRKVELVTGEYYHVYNRSIARVQIFREKREYRRFVDLLKYYRFGGGKMPLSSYKKLSDERREQVWEDIQAGINEVTVCAYSIMPNHFHLLLRQDVDGGVSRYIGNAQNGYAKYLNICRKRTGSAFQQRFRAIRVEDDDQAMQLIRYIYLNPVSAGLCTMDELKEYEWTSLPECLGNRTDNFVDNTLVNGYFKNREEMIEYLTNQVAYSMERRRIKRDLEK